MDGRSLKPLLENPRSGADRAVVSTFGKGRHSVRSQSWRLIRYQDGSSELYNLARDPNEWTNLAGKSQYKEIEADLASRLP